MKLAFIFFCGKPDKFVKQIEKVRSQLLQSKFKVDFFTVGYSGPNGSVDGSNILYSATDCLDLGYRRKGRKSDREFTLKPGNCDVPILRFFHDFSDYDHYFVMEDDVVFTGNLATLVDELSIDDSDLLCTHVHDCPRAWDYQTSFKSPNVIVKNTLLCFLPFFRVSNRALLEIHDAYSAGWDGHHEITWPNILRSHDLKVTDIGGSGTYVEEEFKDRFYYGHVTHAGRKEGTFVPTPPKFLFFANKSILYHPVKQPNEWFVGQLKRLKSIFNYYLNALVNNSNAKDI